MLTPDQLSAAVQQMKAHCQSLMDRYEAGTGPYKMVSARGVLGTIGFDNVADEVLQYMADRGFDYCLDPKYGNRPSAAACVWGADQLESRIAFGW